MPSRPFDEYSSKENAWEVTRDMREKAAERFRKATPVPLGCSIATVEQGGKYPLRRSDRHRGHNWQLHAHALPDDLAAVDVHQVRISGRKNVLQIAIAHDVCSTTLFSVLDEVAHPARFELTTSAFGGQRSIQLSYGCRPESGGCPVNGRDPSARVRISQPPSRR